MTGRPAAGPDHSRADAVTVSVLSEMNAPDPRIGRLTQSLVMHVHAFLVENQVTWEEWLAGLDFLARAGQWTTPARNELLLLSDTTGSSTLLNALNRHRPAPDGPATPEHPLLSDAPLRPMGEVLATEEQWAGGDWTRVHGHVLDAEGHPVAGARIGLWQAHGAGESSSPPRGSRALLTTGTDGAFWFRTVKPRSYRLPTDGPGGEWLRATGRHPVRPGNILVRVEAEGHHLLTKRLFAADDPLLALDVSFGVADGLVLDFHRDQDPVAIEANRMPGPYFEVACDLVLTPGTPIHEAEA
ncbi:dioxygenase [Streptomyces sp. NPDC005899]|uniref:dioxygenase family protein n=1 Tax=Streptomyces sp. NPDC005899 TaxID=3155716 RepID=UPI0033FCEB4C